MIRTARVAVPLAFLSFAVVFHSAAPVAQEPCRAPAPAASTEVNIFTPEQEVELGDIQAELFEPALLVVEDEALTAPLKEIGARLIQHLPGGLHVRFSLIDIPTANAFATPGRVYVTRKLLALAKTEDELAGVVGHELGHLVARQQTFAITRQLREVLNVTSVGDRRDIFEKYNRLLDNQARRADLIPNRKEEDRDQLEADRIGLFAVAAAGYDPNATITFFDRIFGTGGDTGSFLSNLFGVTSPDSKRLAELIRGNAAVTARCDKPQPRDPSTFRQWQSSVTVFHGQARKEALHGVVSKASLTPKLRGEVSNLRFSPDGRYVLAQDDAGIAVLTRDPFAVHFRVDMADAHQARFSADSQELLLHTEDFRIERWSLASRTIIESHDLYRPDGCLVDALSPDGRQFICVEPDFDFFLIDVATGAPVFQKKRISTGILINGVTADFSPDGRYAIAGYSSAAFMGVTAAEEGALIYDTRDKKVLALRPDATRLLTTSFAFLSADKLVGVNSAEPARSGVVTLPSGTVEALQLTRSAIDTPTRGQFVLLRPFQKYAVGVFNLSTKTVVKGNPQAAFDMYDDVFVAERGTGDIGLYSVDGNRVLGSVTLPERPFGQIRAATVSADQNLLAVSEKTRGAVWDLSSGATLLTPLRGFQGAVFDSTGQLFADMPKSGADPRAIMRINARSHGLSVERDIADTPTEQFAQYSRLLAVTRPIPRDAPNPTGWDLELFDVTRSLRLWSRSFPKDPPKAWGSPAGDSIILAWTADSPIGRDAIKQNERLRSSVNLSDLLGDYVVEVLDTERGMSRGRVFIETGKGSFRLRAAFARDDWMVVSDSQGRVLVYSVATGELKGHAFGGSPVISTVSALLCVNLGGGRLAIHDLATMHRRDQFTFTTPVVMTSFSADGKRLFVLTSDQTAYVLDLGAAGS